MNLAQRGKRRTLGWLEKGRNLGRDTDLGKETRELAGPSRALSWVRNHELATGGIRVHSQHASAYPEVTGYLVPTLLDYGERELAAALVRWLVCIQRSDGCYTDPDEGAPYVFDTGQVLRGLLRGSFLAPGARDAARRAADYLLRQMVEGGRKGFAPRYSGAQPRCPESVHVYVLPSLFEAARALGIPDYQKAADRCLEYYCNQPDFLQGNDLTHFLAYQIEALLNLGRAGCVKPVLEALREQQQPDGSVRGIGGASWVCTPGLAQLAICWYKTGAWEAADKALAWLEGHQEPSGGFRGSHGQGASYFPNVELSWAAKFYLDAHLLRVKAFFERNASIFPTTISKEDGRVQAILAMVQPGNKVLEVGCGKGRFLKVVQETIPNVTCTGVDISPALLASVPSGIQTIQGSLETIPCLEDSFEVVFSVEAIEHSPNLRAAVAEMVRVVRPGGWVIVIDKQRAAWGRLSCPPWEQWPGFGELKTLLSTECAEITATPIGYNGKPATDGLMVAWRARKRSSLSGAQWNQVLMLALTQQAVVERVRSNRLSAWAQTMLLATAHGEKVLEIGSGTGEISLQLAQAGREVTTLDYSEESLEFQQRCAAELGIVINKTHADATQPLTFSDEAFDCVWSSGLLEHFTSEQRQAMLREWGRVARKKLISIVPNAASVAYRAGKALLEKQGEWPYGREIPLLSLRADYEAAGWRVQEEFSVGALHSLIFLPARHPLRTALSAWFTKLSPSELDDCNQGYLLVTLGTK